MSAPPRNWVQRLGLAAGPLIAAPFFWHALAQRSSEAAAGGGLAAMAGVGLWMATWWITEAAPLAATSVLPIVLFPLLSISPGTKITETYGDYLIFLFLGGCLLASAIEDSGLHRRLALSIVSVMGDNPRRVVFGFMLATYLLSNWLSNTATTLMLYPIALSVLANVDREKIGADLTHRFGACLMLGLAYAASIGGMATLVGTPTNLVFKGYYESNFAGAEQISFLRWGLVAFPLSFTMLVLSWAAMARWQFRLPATSLLGGRSGIREQLAALGPMSRGEKRTALMFGLTALLWILRWPDEGQGWAYWLGLYETKTDAAGAVHLRPTIDDATVAMGMAVLCFLIPSGNKDGKALVEPAALARVPWSILLLFGGGLALGKGMSDTNLDDFLGGYIGGRLAGFPNWAMTGLVSGFMVFFSEVTSNIACLTMFLPVLKGTCDSLGIEPRPLMVAATFAASCGFALPIATGANAIVYGSGHVRMKDMLCAGLVLDLIGIALVTLFVMLIPA